MAVALVNADLLSVPAAHVRTYVMTHVPEEILRHDEAARLRRVLSVTVEEYDKRLHPKKRPRLSEPRLMGEQQLTQGQSPREVWRQMDWSAKLERQPLDVVLRDAEIAARRMRDPSERAECVRELPLEMLLHPLGKQFRDMLPVGDLLEVFVALAMRERVGESQLRDVLEQLGTLDLEASVDWWIKVLESSPHASFFQERMPNLIALELLRREYAPFLQALEVVDAFDLPDFVWCSADELYGHLEDADRLLAGVWAGPNASDFALATMLSARAAERAAARFYEGLGFQVEDVAVRQVTDGADREWVTHDFRVVGHGPVDVKNARSATNSRGGYSEHTVPAFKEDRYQQDVIVAGVRSPYVKLEEFANPTDIPHNRNHSIVVLGECTRQRLSTLRRDYLSTELQSLTIGRHERMGGRGRRRGELLPPWVFDYPDALYEQEEIASYRSSIARIVELDPPPLAVLEKLGVNPIPLYLQGGVLPEGWRAVLREWEVRLGDRIIAASCRSLPRLFLTLLTDFLSAIRQMREDYSPDVYRRFLYARVTPGQHEALWHAAPLGIADPLRSIASLVRTLELLWHHRKTSRLSEFTRFRFSGAGLLRGVREGEASVTTVLAYCGGRTPKHGPCGNAPLVLGLHEACPQCGFLICEKCGHCMEHCPLCKARQERH